MSGLQMFQTSRVGVEDGGGEEEDEEGVDLGQREDAEESKEEWQVWNGCKSFRYQAFRLFIFQRPIKSLG